VVEVERKSQIPGKQLRLDCLKLEKKVLKFLNPRMSHLEEVRKATQGKEEKAVAHVLEQTHRFLTTPGEKKSPGDFFYRNLHPYIKRSWRLELVTFAFFALLGALCVQCTGEVAKSAKSAKDGLTPAVMPLK
jgi:hypothetical protein